MSTDQDLQNADYIDFDLAEGEQAAEAAEKKADDDSQVFWKHKGGEKSPAPTVTCRAWESARC